MKKLTLLILPLLMSAQVMAQNAERIMAQVRQVTALQDNQSLQGYIRTTKFKTPVSLFLEGGNIQFALNGGKERFHLRLNEDDQDLLEYKNGKWKKFSPQKLVQPIAASDMTYEDLALKFLYWDNPRIVGEDKVKGQKCWRIHVANPGENGDYREVSVWVAQKQRALMRVTAYNGKRQPIKQFEITDIMKVGKVYTVEKMKVSSVKNGRVDSTTYLEFDKPKTMAAPRR